MSNIEAIPKTLNLRISRVFNRSKKIINIDGTNKYTKDYSLINSYLIKSDLIINTTPTNPLNKKQTSLIKKTTIISDIVYQPKETNFLKEFKFNKKIYGISMLIEQALPCFKQWFGFFPAVDETLIKKLNKTEQEKVASTLTAGP